MNKNNKLLIGMLTFVVVCVVGYALFSENITVTGSATASGDWGIAASCSDTIPSEVREDYEITDIQGGFTDDSCTVSGNTITSKATLLYPTAMKLHHAEYKNTGSVNAMFKIGPDATAVLKDASTQPNALTGEMRLYNKSNDQLYDTINLEEALDEIYYGIAFIDKVYIKTASGEYLNTKTEILGNKSLYKDADGNYYLQIKPGESIVFILSETWDKKAEQTDYYSIMELSIDIKLQQQTDDLIEVTNINGPFDMCLNHC